MDQKKTGRFFKELRNEKGWTQEQLAEKLNVSGRTISRWETGNNMPDLDMLIEMADFYDVDIRELIDGERKSEKMNKDMEETVLKVADYSNEEKEPIDEKTALFFLGRGYHIYCFSRAGCHGLSRHGDNGTHRLPLPGIFFWHADRSGPLHEPPYL
ncbi:helix-turn-helix transcriptional regulator [Emergencia timonensis]|uniref:helix-turn-helix domain-containing protein n=1 Tax=Emergencia timonensis TaxID=1776384 RepID=UPI00295B9915|nr:helix-turn-helix transcriptional regulator [Emergencia timonensis]WNX89797.1 helix-turn-helix transcriptional regulator [Emergencia timonensis]